MILKIRHKGGWWEYDGLRRIHFGVSAKNMGFVDVDRVVKNRHGQFFRIPFGANLSEEEVSAKEGGFVPDVDLTHDYETTEPYPVRWACVRDDKNDETFFVFNVGYILNDRGKTIETLK